MVIQATGEAGVLWEQLSGELYMASTLMHQLIIQVCVGHEAKQLSALTAALEFYASS